MLLRNARGALIVFGACNQFKSSKSGAMRILVCRHARLRSPWPLPPRLPMAAMLRAGRDVIVDPRPGPRPLRGPGGGPQTAWAACPKSQGALANGPPWRRTRDVGKGSGPFTSRRLRLRSREA